MLDYTESIDVENYVLLCDTSHFLNFGGKICNIFKMFNTYKLFCFSQSSDDTKVFGTTGYRSGMS